MPCRIYVEPHRRLRVEKACDLCKSRKQKCNGKQPCQTCIRRGNALTCSYHTPRVGRPSRRSAAPYKANGVRGYPNTGEKQTGNLDHARYIKIIAPTRRRALYSDRPFSKFSEMITESNDSLFQYISDPISPLADKWSNPPRITAQYSSVIDSTSKSENLTAPLRLDNATPYLYDNRVGDSATLSHLQTILGAVNKLNIETASLTDAAKQFEDRQLNDCSHKPLLSEDFSAPRPPREVADYLKDSFIQNTQGFIEILPVDSIVGILDAWFYEFEPIPRQSLCLMYLILAIGALLLLEPTQDVMIDEQKKYRDFISKGKHTEQAQLFYDTAIKSWDPRLGISVASHWKVEALCLMTLYLLLTCRRDQACSLHGLAIQYAATLGIHKVPQGDRSRPHLVQDQNIQGAYENLWRSLFVMDRFISLSRGRDIMIPNMDRQDPHSVFLRLGPNTDTHSSKLAAAVESSFRVGVALTYNNKTLNSELAPDIAAECSKWLEDIPQDLHWQNSIPRHPGDKVVRLTLNLLYCHSIVLFTRPFLLKLMHLQQSDQRTEFQQRPGVKSCARKCVELSCYSILLVTLAHRQSYLSYHNAFILYFLFDASLILLSSQLFNIYTHDKAYQAIESAITIFEACGDAPEAKSMEKVLKSYYMIVGSLHKLAATPPADERIVVHDPVRRMSYYSDSAIYRCLSATDPSKPRKGTQKVLPFQGSGLMPQSAPSSNLIIPSASADISEETNNLGVPSEGAGLIENLIHGNIAKPLGSNREMPDGMIPQSMTLQHVVPMAQFQLSLGNLHPQQLVQQLLVPQPFVNQQFVTPQVIPQQPVPHNLDPLLALPIEMNQFIPIASHNMYDFPHEAVYHEPNPVQDIEDSGRNQNYNGMSNSIVNSGAGNNNDGSGNRKIGGSVAAPAAERESAPQNAINMSFPAVGDLQMGGSNPLFDKPSDDPIPDIRVLFGDGAGEDLSMESLMYDIPSDIPSTAQGLLVPEFRTMLHSPGMLSPVGVRTPVPVGNTLDPFAANEGMFDD